VAAAAAVAAAATGCVARLRPKPMMAS
jgi:hypothetical protein